MGKIDIEQYEEFLSSESKEFINKYGEDVEDQSEIIAEKNDIKDNDALEKLLGKLSYIKEEYLVNGALLTCSQGSIDKTTLMHKGETIDCEFNLLDNRKRLHICNRNEKINGLAPATVKDCKGGLRDDIEKNEDVNIVSMGNCGFIKKMKRLKKS